MTATQLKNFHVHVQQGNDAPRIDEEPENTRLYDTSLTEPYFSLNLEREGEAACNRSYWGDANSTLDDYDTEKVGDLCMHQGLLDSMVRTENFEDKRIFTFQLIISVAHEITLFLTGFLSGPEPAITPEEITGGMDQRRWRSASTQTFLLRRLKMLLRNLEGKYEGQERHPGALGTAPFWTTRVKVITAWFKPQTREEGQAAITVVEDLMAAAEAVVAEVDITDIRLCY
ncbi:hypothetical protein VE03_10049 [Pseudogymnoascus sp. 23342-1-I1]|nr:hypothetical protein VE03_10049 [Pseudogymnoascus sp. 23342-1-I1]